MGTTRVRGRSIRAEEFSREAAAFVQREHPSADETSVLLGPVLQRIAKVQSHQSESLVLRDLGLGYSGFTAVFLLQVFGPLEAQSLARVMGVSRQAMSTTVANLEKAGLLSRTQGDDRRTFVLELTAEGERVGTAALEQQAGLSERWFEVLSEDERATLLDMLQRVIAHARRTGEAGASLTEEGADR